VILAMLIGAVGGAGLLLLSYAISPPRVDLAAAVGRFDARRAAAPIPVAESPTWAQRVAGRAATHMIGRGLVRAGTRENLAVAGRTLEQHFVSKFAVALVGLLIPVGLAVVLTTAGLRINSTVPAIIGLAMAAGFFFVPDLALTQAADVRRKELRRALACYLDLVSMSLAGGRGVPEALSDSARIGRGRGFDLLSGALAHARYAGTSTWEAFADLGYRTGVTELRDLGSALALVADDGAKIRDSLSARAATSRARQLAEAEGDAERASESIKNAHLLLGFAFLVFLAYPAIAAVMAI
jgi:tight adherence protein C